MGGKAAMTSLWISQDCYQLMVHKTPSYFHLHLVSDATGETLTTIAKASAVQFRQVRAIEHVYPLVRTGRQLESVSYRRWNQHQALCSTPSSIPELVAEIENGVAANSRYPCVHVLEADHECI